MSPRATQPRTEFYGQHHRQFLLPLAGQARLQFHNLEEGEFFNAADALRLRFTFICPADPVRPRWNVDIDNFLVLYNQRTDAMFIQCFHRPENSAVFFLQLRHGLYTPGFNALEVPTGNFAFGGTVTLKWRGLPL